ncbi:DEAD/DEAH box helicase [Candidatus Woesearchaeota archaeon]|nr:DEAD/DEAH box helicase [Candidatus Woesearchaeota archaeon]
MDYKGLVLDKFQEDAIAAIEKNHSVVVSAPTGSGKTLIADYIIDRDVKKGIKVIYTAPIKALSNQKYKDFCKQYGEHNVGIMTGDTVKNSHAPIVVMTTEIYRNMAITKDPALNDISYVIFDEIHYISDIDRGYVWEESIIFSAPNVRLLCLSATIPNAEEFAAWIQAIKGHPVDVIRHDIRPVPLHVQFYDTELGICALKDIKNVIDIPDERYIRGRSHNRRPRIPPPFHADLIKEIKHQIPLLYFAFSRAATQQKAEQLAKLKLFPVNNEISSYMINKFKDAPPEINKLASTKMLRHTLSQGIAFHHAGLLPVIKELVEELFAQGKINVLYTTETFAVGINMPAKAVCFEALRKFDGRNFRWLNSKEFFQIAGRAGRRGIDPEGHVYAMINRFEFEHGIIKEMTTRDVTPIQSQFRISVNTVLNLIKRHSHEEIDEILCKSFHSWQKYGKKFDTLKSHKSHLSFNNYVKKLEKMGYLKEGLLTDKGEFLANIYADELVTGEIFATQFCKNLDPYQIMLLLGAICFEGKRTEFRKKYPSESLHRLKKQLRSTLYLKDDRRFEYLDELTALFHPCYNGANLFEILDYSSLLEGDLVRYFRQILDRLKQISIATQDRELQDKLRHVDEKLNVCLKDIDIM